MAKGARQLTSFLAGIISIAFVIGIVTGASASPVVSILIPLLFGLFSIGGAVVAQRSPGTSGDDSGPPRPSALALIGKQLFCFSVGFIVGLWLGIAAKVHSAKLWPSPANAEPAFTAMKFDDLLVLRAAIDLDSRLRSAGVSFADRRVIFTNLNSAIEQRAKGSDPTDPNEVASSDRDAAKAILQVPKEPSIFDFPLLSQTPGANRSGSS